MEGLRARFGMQLRILVIAILYRDSNLGTVKFLATLRACISYTVYVWKIHLYGQK
jgi:hypothetical protein